MKVLIIGGTGGTGMELIKQALQAGHEVTALVRNPAKLKIIDPHLQTVKGNVLDAESVQKAIAGQEAVLSALGHKRFIIYTTTISEGTKNMVKAMEMQGVKRFICITTLGRNDSGFKMGLYYPLFVIPVITFFYFLDKRKQEKIIRCSKLNWTIVRPAQLTNGKLTGKYKHGENMGNYIITKLISRANVAHFMLSQLQDTTYVHKAPGITNY